MIIQDLKKFFLSVPASSFYLQKDKLEFLPKNDGASNLLGFIHLLNYNSNYVHLPQLFLLYFPREGGLNEFLGLIPFSRKDDAFVWAQAIAEGDIVLKGHEGSTPQERLVNLCDFLSLFYEKNINIPLGHYRNLQIKNQSSEWNFDGISSLNKRFAR